MLKSSADSVKSSSLKDKDYRLNFFYMDIFLEHPHITEKKRLLPKFCQILTLATKPGEKFLPLSFPLALHSYSGL